MQIHPKHISSTYEPTEQEGGEKRHPRVGDVKPVVLMDQTAAGEKGGNKPMRIPVYPQ